MPWKTLQGVYKPVNAIKYRGTQPIVYRSGLELNFFRWADRNNKVLCWGSESVVIPYISPKDGRQHKYFVDGVLHLQTESGVKKYLIEIKPSCQIVPPSGKHRKNKNNLMLEQLTYAVNQSKWESARAWCDKNGYNFTILTEKDLK